MRLRKCYNYKLILDRNSYNILRFQNKCATTNARSALSKLDTFCLIFPNTALSSYLNH